MVLASHVVPAFATERALPADPRQRLEALQHALVKEAMAGQTRVRSAAYIDSAGQLHETTRITSDMQVRGVRVLSYLEDEGSTSASIAVAGRAVTGSEEACRVMQQKYRREATLEAALLTVASGTDRYDMTMLMDQARRRLIAQASAQRSWLLTTPASAPESMYERLLTGAGTEVTPFQMVLHILPAGSLGVEAAKIVKTPGQKAKALLQDARSMFADEPAWRAAMPFVMRLSVTERSSQKLLWQNAVPLAFPQTEITATSQPIPATLIKTIDRVLQHWLEQLDTRFGCGPVQFNAVPEGSGNWAINGGQAAGVSVGDQLLLMDRDRLPARVLEPESVRHMALVEVVQVRAGKATVRKLAGPADMPKSGDWVVTPF